MESKQNWRTVLPFLVGLALFGLLAMWDHSRDFHLWRNYALSGIAMGSIATWAIWHYDVRIPHYIQWMIIGGLLAHYVGGSIGSPDPYKMGVFGSHGINGAYHTFHWWDNLTHGVGIGASAMGIAYLIEVYQQRRGFRWPPQLVGALALLAALAAGVGVELYEYLGKELFQTIDQGGYENTMTDLVFNFLGAAAGTIIAVYSNRTWLRQRIREHWPETADRPVLWHRRISPNMVGFAFFVTIPALTALALAVQFLIAGPAAQDLSMYDHALRILTRSAVAGTMSAPLAAMAAREVQRRVGGTPA